MTADIRKGLGFSPSATLSGHRHYLPSLNVAMARSRRDKVRLDGVQKLTLF